MASPNSPPSLAPLFIFISVTIFNLFLLVSANSDLSLGHKLGRGGGGGRRSLMSFKEKATGSNITYDCSPSGPCVYCLYSEKNDEKYRCSETGYRIPLKCVETGTTVDKGKSKKTKKGRSAVENEDSSKTDRESEPYITYRSCIPAVDEEKLSVLGFEVLMLGLLLASGSAIFLKKRQNSVMQGAVRVPTSSRF